MGGRLSRVMSSVSSLLSPKTYGGYSRGLQPKPLGLGHPPVVFVVGATGTGKSKLAVAIAKQFNGEIISADSMQIYKGLDVLTNKVTTEEMDGCVHHMLSFVDPVCESYSVKDFQIEATQLVKDALARGKLPIVVGGTTYYVESLIWETLVSNTPDISSDEESGSAKLQTVGNDVSTTGSLSAASGLSPTLSTASSTMTALPTTSSSTSPSRPTATSSEGDNASSVLPLETSPNVPIAPACSQSGSDVLEVSNRACSPSVLPPQAGLTATETSSCRTHDPGSPATTSQSISARLTAEFLLKKKTINNRLVDYSTVSPVAESLGLSPEEVVTKLDYTVLQRAIPYVHSPRLHALLMHVDPTAARAIHPNTVRKILRCLSVFSRLGRPISEVWGEQRQAAAKSKNLSHQSAMPQGDEITSTLAIPLRYKNAVVFWIQCDKTVLDVRLDSRVDSMLRNGFVEELVRFHERYNCERIAREENEEAHYTKGVYQSIGFKQFVSYLTMSEEDKQTLKGIAAFRQGVTDMQIATKRYSRYQIKWLRKRFLTKRSSELVPPVFKVDGTDPSQWEEKVETPALAVIDSFLRGEVPHTLPMSLEKGKINRIVSRTCELCQTHFIYEIEWENHIRGNSHKRKLKWKRNKERYNKHLLDTKRKAGAQTKEESACASKMS